MEDVVKFMQQKLPGPISKNEQIYLILHIARLAKSQGQSLKSS